MQRLLTAAGLAIAIMVVAGTSTASAAQVPGTLEQPRPA
jgi:hypothetical protein